MQTTVRLTTDFIKLDALIKLVGVTDSGGEAKHLILEGRVLVNGAVASERGRKLRGGDVVTVMTARAREGAAPEALIRVLAAGSRDEGLVN
jgi:ribosome-associated protein